MWMNYLIWIMNGDFYTFPACIYAVVPYIFMAIQCVQHNIHRCIVHSIHFYIIEHVRVYNRILLYMYTTTRTQHSTRIGEFPVDINSRTLSISIIAFRKNELLKICKFACLYYIYRDNTLLLLIYLCKNNLIKF